MIYPLGEGRGKLQKEELERINRTPTESLEAYDYFLQGMFYVDKHDKNDNLRAREMFEKAINSIRATRERSPKTVGRMMPNTSTVGPIHPRRRSQRPWR